jgi:hypothetical protein
MEYLIPVALLVLLVGGFVTFVAMYSASKGGPGEHDRNAADSTDARPGMGTDAVTDLGDTDQLSDVSEGGRFTRETQPEPHTVDAPESERLANRPA